MVFQNGVAIAVGNYYFFFRGSSSSYFNNSTYISSFFCPAAATVHDWNFLEIIFCFLLLCSCCFWYFSGGFQLNGVYNKSDGYQIMSYSQYRRLLIIVVLSRIRTFFGGHFVHQENKRVFSNFSCTFLNPNNFFQFEF